MVWGMFSTRLYGSFEPYNMAQRHISAISHHMAPLRHSAPYPCAILFLRHISAISCAILFLRHNTWFVTVSPLHFMTCLGQVACWSATLLEPYWSHIAISVCFQVLHLHLFAFRL